MIQRQIGTLMRVHGVNNLARRVLRLSGRFVAGVQGVVGFLMVAGALADLYMILMHGARPGEPTYFNELAPTVGEAATALLCGMALVFLAFAAPSLVRLLRRRVRRPKHVA
jgi:hypothetical protein